METNFANKNHLPALFSSDPAAIAAAETAKARIQSAYIMAFQKPRNEDDARDRILHACKRPGFAERVEFNKPVGGRQIKGPSIRFAELALREWENILTETQVLYEDDFIRRIKVIVTDLETNASHSKEIQINKTVERRKANGREVVGERTNTANQKVFIVKATEDELYNKEAALISKALRNEGLRLIPSDITDEAIEAARQTLRNRDAQDPDAAKKKILDAFSSIGVKPRDLERYLKHKTDTLTPAELEDLRGIYRAIRDGEARWSDYLQTSKEPKEPETTPQDFDAIIPKGIDPAKLEEFLKLCAEQYDRSIDDIKAEAAEDPNGFWSAFSHWQKQQKPTKKPEVEKDPDDFWSKSQENKEMATMTKNEENILLTASFSRLNKEPLQKFEKTHREEISTWPQIVQDAFDEKWEAKMKQPYQVFLRRLEVINNKSDHHATETPKAGQGTVVCPPTGEAKTYAACENTCPGVMFKEQSCLERFPEK